jgi:hypothetical protein
VPAAELKNKAISGTYWKTHNCFFYCDDVCSQALLIRFLLASRDANQVSILLWFGDVNELAVAIQIVCGRMMFLSFRHLCGVS